MKIYNYLLFRMYSLLSKGNNNTKEIHFYITILSTFIIIISIQVCLVIYDYYFSSQANREGISKSLYSLIFLIVSYINYFLFIRKNKFLKYGFKQDKKRDYYIIGFLIFLITVAIIIGNRNCEKIRNENERMRIEKLK